MPINADPSTPPPTIGKIGPYTVFITPPPTPQPPSPIYDTPKKVVCPPAPQIQSSNLPGADDDSSSVRGFFRTAVTKVQHVNSSLDEHLARWFGLNQSKYQWALDDYFETKGLDAKAKDAPKKAQNV
ncbi:hypothetical protein LINGRAPRIM_LOCUS1357 [Linum grandiflorum]